MSEALVLVVLLAGGSEATTDGIMAATRRALGPDAIVLADTSEPASDADALAIGERVHARAIARVRWDAELGTARLHVHVAGPRDEWVDDELTFQPQDAAAEKGRTVGFTLGSMVQRLERERREEAEAKPAPPPPEPPPPPDPRPAAPKPKSDVDLFAAVVGAVGGSATALGAAAGARWFPSTHLGVRGAVGARAGSVAEADATATTLFAAAGPIVRTELARTVEVGVRTDIVVLRQAMTREQAAGLEATRSRWLGAADLVVELGWAPTAHAAVMVGVGAELAFGATDIDVGGATVAELPLMRGIAEVGARFRF